MCHWFSTYQKCRAAATCIFQHGIDGNMFEQTTRSESIELGVSEERAHDVHQALHTLSVKTVTWAAQEHVAGVDYNDESHDVEVGSARDLSDGGR